MEIIKKPSFNPNLALALGFFDGVHIAHQKLINEVINYSKKYNVKSGIITFKNNPLCDLKSKNFNTIYKNEDKFKILEDLGVDYCYVFDFKDFLNLSADEYLENVLIRNFKPKFITTGFNHHFGRNKTGDSEFLRNNQEKYGYIYKEIPPIKINSKLVSTTNIKKMLESGNVIEANNFLGRDFWVKNKVERGLNFGEKLGFKTANLSWDEDIVKLPYGVYKTRCLVRGKNYDALSNWGVCPTINKNKETLEVHILDFSENIYNEEIKVSFKEKIRDEKKFNSQDELIGQIKKDLEVF